ncbi:DUF58 domain-containing protein [Oleiharenicola lentus]|uniref:DUF58 domain-containing protein n=1 Tax=Oleiharenicola lentus TaxID=2508720 RepID=UPI003F66EF03
MSEQDESFEQPITMSELASPALLRRLEWRVQHAVQTMLTGDYRSAFRGRGMEFDQVLKYNWGDDLRDIDWNVTARLGEPYRKKFVEEREVTVLLVFEDSPALQFGSAGRTRRDTLLELAALMMLLGATNRDRVGLLYCSPEGFWLRRPQPGREYTRRTASMLLGQPPPALDAGGTVEVPWRLALRGVAAHSILVWLGPFLETPVADEWALLRRRYQIMGARADDPWDFELPKARRFAAFDPLAGRLMTLHTGEAERAAHEEWRHRRDDYFQNLFPDSRDQLVARTDEPVFDVMVDFFRRHQRVPSKPQGEGGA